MTKDIAPYGSWKSSITADLMVEGARPILEVNVTAEAVFWLELRPSEGGRSALMCADHEGAITEVSPPDWNIRTRVHEYGGGAIIADQDYLFGVRCSDQRIYAMTQAPTPLTAAGARFADFRVDRTRQRLITVRERHHDEPAEVVNDLVSVELETGALQVIAAGHDFYTSPRLSPDGKQLAFMTWDHPNMPWDSTTLWVGDINVDGTLSNVCALAGGEGESVIQPEWSPEGVLHYLSDKSGFWNLYRVESEHRPLWPMAAEFGAPHWVFGLSFYDFADADTLVCTFFENGVWHLAEINAKTGEHRRIKTAFVTVRQLHVQGNTAYFVGGTATAPETLVALDLGTGQTRSIRSSSAVTLPAEAISVAEAVQFESSDGAIAHAYYYPPKNPDYIGPPEARPPLLLLSHGGPTSATAAHLNLNIQFWTSRGFAVLDVNYGGSSGYGRRYRDRLKGRWGIVDVDDCAAGALALVSRGLVDGERLAIRGGSAGGFTTLASLVYRDVFHAGSSYFGVSDLTALAEETHKFESRYLDGLIGPYPEAQAVYHERSPVSGINQLACPIIFLQGSEDRVVPPNQAEMMVESLISKGLPVAYLLFEGEDHGFRDAKNIKRALESELYFFGQIFGFVPADKVAPIAIDNWSTA